LGAIAGAFLKGQEDSGEIVRKMLTALRHRGTMIESAGMEGTKPSIFSCTIATSSHDDGRYRFARRNSTALVLDGTFFEREPQEQASFALRHLSQGVPAKKILRQLLIEPAAFASLALEGGRLFALRGINGMKPLYYGQARGLVAIASERKALWRIGLRDVGRLTPGALYSVGAGGVRSRTISRLPEPRSQKMSLRQASARLLRLLERATGRIIAGLDRVGVAFSGGLDSSVVAVLAKRLIPEIHLISVGLSGSVELADVERHARSIGLPIIVRAYDHGTLHHHVRRVVWLVEEPNLTKVSVAIPLHWAAETAAAHGLKVMLCGQGSDELYGGYFKYARTLKAEGRRALEAELYRSVVEASEVNYERDEQATSPFGMELRTPFADLDVIRFSLSIPSEFKVQTGDDTTRKWVLRDAAKRMGLPDALVWKRKKAIQHGTGVENAIRKIAKRRKLTVDEYLIRTHAEVINQESMP